MNLSPITVITVILLSLISIFNLQWSQKTDHSDVNKKIIRHQPLPRVAHAGGAYRGHVYTNSLEALNANAKQYDLFEIDLQFTSDGALVCMHDWTGYKQKVFSYWKMRMEMIVSSPTLKKFEQEALANKNWSPCTLSTLITWLIQHPTKRIITDVKDHNIEALTLIAKSYPAFISHFIPQIYSLKEFPQVKQLGYQDIILTLYKLPGKASRKEALAAIYYDLFAITIPVHRVSRMAKELKSQGMRIYTHTINSEDEFKRLQQLGVDEIYTDHLAKNLTASD